MNLEIPCDGRSDEWCIEWRCKLEPRHIGDTVMRAPEGRGRENGARHYL